MGQDRKHTGESNQAATAADSKHDTGLNTDFKVKQEIQKKIQILTVGEV